MCRGSGGLCAPEVWPSGVSAPQKVVFCKFYAVVLVEDFLIGNEDVGVGDVVHADVVGLVADVVLFQLVELVSCKFVYCHNREFIKWLMVEGACEAPESLANQ